MPQLFAGRKCACRNGLASPDAPIPANFCPAARQKWGGRSGITSVIIGIYIYVCAAALRRSEIFTARQIFQIRSIRIRPSSAPASAADTAFSNRSMEPARGPHPCCCIVRCAPAVARFAQIADDAPLGVSQGILENRVPLVPRQRQENLRIVQIRSLRLCAGPRGVTPGNVACQFSLRCGFSSRSTKGRRPDTRRSSPLPTRSRFVMAMSFPYPPAPTRSVSEARTPTRSVRETRTLTRSVSEVARPSLLANASG